MSNVLAKCMNIAIVHLYSPDDCSYLAEPFDGMADGIIIHVQSMGQSIHARFEKPQASVDWYVEYVASQLVSISKGNESWNAPS